MYSPKKSTLEGRKYPSKKNTCCRPLIFFLLISTILFLSFFLTTHRFTSAVTPMFLASKFNMIPALPGSSSIPRLAYLISGSVGDGEALKRTLRAIYHPLNQYVLHLDREAPVEERFELANFVNSEPIFRKMGNVRMVAKSNMVTYRGPTMVTNTLHAAAILLKEGGDWDWFINLSASDYPLVTQDDILHTFSTIPRDFNFIEHTSDLEWKAVARAEPIIVDPGLYSNKKSDLIMVNQTRELPTAFKLFTGSAWMMLSRSFIEFCIWGWDNLPRTVLVYYANFISTPEGYFQTVICNAEKFRNTTVNHDLHFISWDDPPDQHPHNIVAAEYPKLIESNAPFARKFGKNKDLLDRIDSELLGRVPGGFPKGGWFDRVDKKGFAPGYVVRDVNLLRPGPGAERIKNLTTTLLSDKDFGSTHCI